MASLASLAGINTSVIFGQPATGVRFLLNKDQALFGLKPTKRGRLFMSTYNVQLITPEGPQQPFECPADVSILDQALKKGIKLPFNCKKGTCYSCAGKVADGEVDPWTSGGSLLDDEQMNDGYILTCVAKPLSDVVIMTHKKAELIG